MKKLIPIALVLSVALQAGWMDTLGSIAKEYGKGASSSITDQKRQSDQNSSAIKQALEFGVKKAIATLGKENGFYKNPLVKIGLPKNLQGVASTLKKVGMGKYVDQFELSMNRAAEEAVPQTAKVLIDTIKELKIEEAKKLVMSKEPNAITKYFKTHAGQKLAKKIAPIIKKHMESQNVTKYYQTMMSYYKKYGKRYTDNKYAQMAMGAFGMGQGQEEAKDLSTYVTNKTLQGIYKMIEEQEKAIRTTTAARTTQLLQKVFGGK